jgi:integrase/recombinase XerD
MNRGACNLFRHSTATLMHESGAYILHIQEMVGHAGISTTQVYTHVSIPELQEVYAKTHPAARDPHVSVP